MITVTFRTKIDDVVHYRCFNNWKKCENSYYFPINLLFWKSGLCQTGRQRKRFIINRFSMLQTFQ